MPHGTNRVLHIDLMEHLMLVDFAYFVGGLLGFALCGLAVAAAGRL
jgi:hypothetical protein